MEENSVGYGVNGSDITTNGASSLEVKDFGYVCVEFLCVVCS
jgi:hypothetical protein